MFKTNFARILPRNKGLMIIRVKKFLKPGEKSFSRICVDLESKVPGDADIERLKVVGGKKDDLPVSRSHKDKESVCSIKSIQACLFSVCLSAFRYPLSLFNIQTISLST